MQFEAARSDMLRGGGALYVISELFLIFQIFICFFSVSLKSSQRMANTMFLALLNNKEFPLLFSKESNLNFIISAPVAPSSSLITRSTSTLGELSATYFCNHPIPFKHFLKCSTLSSSRSLLMIYDKVVLIENFSFF